MSTKRKGLLQKVLMLMLVLCLVCGNGLMALANEAVASSMRLTKTEGTVSVTNKNGRDMGTMADMKLFNGYHLSTEQKSYAWMNLDDHKLIKLDAVSEAEIQKKGKNLEVLLNSGNLLFNVTENLKADETLNIRTSTMVTGIRGTCGWVNVIDASHTQVYILEGRVECYVMDPITGQYKSIVLNSGEMAEFVVYDQTRIGDKCDIIVNRFSEKDIDGFVAIELLNSSDLRDRITNAMNVDINWIFNNAPGVLVQDQNNVEQKFAPVNDAVQKQENTVVKNPLFGEDKDDDEEGSGGSSGDSYEPPIEGPTSITLTVTEAETDDQLNYYLTMDGMKTITIVPSENDVNNTTLDIITTTTVSYGQVLALNSGVNLNVNEGVELRINGKVTVEESVINNGIISNTCTESLEVTGSLTNTETGSIDNIGHIEVRQGIFENSGSVANFGSIEGNIDVQRGRFDNQAGTVTGNMTVGTFGVVGVNGGRITQIGSENSPSTGVIDIVGGTVGSIHVEGYSQGDGNEVPELVTTPIVTLSEGGKIGTLEMEMARVTISDSGITGELIVNDDGNSLVFEENVTIKDLTVNGNYQMDLGTNVTVTGDVTMTGNATLVVSGDANVNSITANEYVSVLVTGGTITGGIDLNGSSSVNVNGPSAVIEGGIRANDDSAAYIITGKIAGGIVASNRAKVQVIDNIPEYEPGGTVTVQGGIKMNIDELGQTPNLEIMFGEISGGVELEGFAYAWMHEPEEENNEPPTLDSIVLKDDAKLKLEEGVNILAENISDFITFNDRATVQFVPKKLDSFILTNESIPVIANENGSKELVLRRYAEDIISALEGLGDGDLLRLDKEVGEYQVSSEDDQFYLEIFANCDEETVNATIDINGCQLTIDESCYLLIHGLGPSPASVDTEASNHTLNIIDSNGGGSLTTHGMQNGANLLLEDIKFYSLEPYSNVEDMPEDYDILLNTNTGILEFANVKCQISRELQNFGYMKYADGPELTVDVITNNNQMTIDGCEYVITGYVKNSGQMDIKNCESVSNARRVTNSGQMSVTNCESWDSSSIENTVKMDIIDCETVKTNNLINDAQDAQMNIFRSGLYIQGEEDSDAENRMYNYGTIYVENSDVECAGIFENDGQILIENDAENLIQFLYEARNTGDVSITGGSLVLATETEWMNFGGLWVNGSVIEAHSALWNADFCELTAVNYTMSDEIVGYASGIYNSATLEISGGVFGRYNNNAIITNHYEGGTDSQLTISNATINVMGVDKEDYSPAVVVDSGYVLIEDSTIKSDVDCTQAKEPYGLPCLVSVQYNEAGPNSLIPTDPETGDMLYEAMLVLDNVDIIANKEVGLATGSPYVYVEIGEETTITSASDEATVYVDLWVDTSWDVDSGKYIETLLYPVVTGEGVVKNTGDGYLIEWGMSQYIGYLEPLRNESGQNTTVLELIAALSADCDRDSDSNSDSNSILSLKYSKDDSAFAVLYYEYDEDEGIGDEDAGDEGTGDEDAGDEEDTAKREEFIPVGYELVLDEDMDYYILSPLEVASIYRLEPTPSTPSNATPSDATKPDNKDENANNATSSNASPSNATPSDASGTPTGASKAAIPMAVAMLAGLMAIVPKWLDDKNRKER